MKENFLKWKIFYSLLFFMEKMAGFELTIIFFYFFFFEKFNGFSLKFHEIEKILPKIRKVLLWSFSLRTIQTMTPNCPFEQQVFLPFLSFEIKNMQIREKQETLSLMLDFLPDQWSFGIPLLNRKPVSKISGKTVGIYFICWPVFPNQTNKLVSLDLILCEWCLVFSSFFFAWPWIW